jgi:hypothetical protein
MSFEYQRERKFAREENYSQKEQRKKDNVPSIEWQQSLKIFRRYTLEIAKREKKHQRSFETLSIATLNSECVLTGTDGKEM